MSLHKKKRNSGASGEGGRRRRVVKDSHSPKIKTALAWGTHASSSPRREKQARQVIEGAKARGDGGDEGIAGDGDQPPQRSYASALVLRRSTGDAAGPGPAGAPRQRR